MFRKSAKYVTSGTRVYTCCQRDLARREISRLNPLLRRHGHANIGRAANRFILFNIICEKRLLHIMFERASHRNHKMKHERTHKDMKLRIKNELQFTCELRVSFGANGFNQVSSITSPHSFEPVRYHQLSEYIDEVSHTVLWQSVFTEFR